MTEPQPLVAPDIEDGNLTDGDLRALGVPWWRLAECATSDPELFHPPGNRFRHDAYRICREQCPVRDICLRQALREGDVDYGLRGGEPPWVRKQMWLDGLSGEERVAAVARREQGLAAIAAVNAARAAQADVERAA